MSAEPTKVHCAIVVSRLSVPLLKIGLDGFPRCLSLLICLVSPHVRNREQEFARVFLMRAILGGLMEVAMRVGLSLVLFLGLSTFGSTAAAQDAAPQKQVVRIPDGGTSGRMESIFIPPKAGAPFSMTLLTEWSRPLNNGNGGTFTLTNERRIQRDSKGRIYQERWLLVPKGSKIQSIMDIFQITDPELHTWYNCETATKVCNLYRYSLTTQDNFQPAIGTSGPMPNGNGFRQHEDLGLSSTEGVETHGYRETSTINAGVLGNDQPMVSTREFWYSPQLAINLISIVDTPQSGKQVFTAKNLTTSEPEPSYFNVPEGYKVVDRLNEP
jgi:hypothetical protein